MTAQAEVRRPGASGAPPPSAPRALSGTQWWTALGAIVALAGLLRMWGGPEHTDVGNAYYAATALSMSQDWVAFLTGAVDSSGFITMDKPAVWLWPSAALVALFGTSWATLFLPTALAGTASVLVLALAVREGSRGARGRGAALLAALALAVSPVNVAVDRANTPDAILLLCLLLAAFATLRAVRLGRLRWLLAAGVMIGMGFDAKYLQAWLVLPALAAAVLVAGAGPLRRRIGHLAAAGATTVAACAAWPLLVLAAVPADRRPWVGSSPDGTFLGRLQGIVGVHLERPISTGGPAEQILAAFGTGEVFHSGPAGPARLLTGVLADQVSWWVPAAVLGAVVLALGPRGGGRPDPARASLVLWSVWGVTCAVLFSLMPGVLHPYYTGLLVPALAALAAGGLTATASAWRRTGGIALPALWVLVLAGWAVVVLLGTSAVQPGWLLPVVAVAGVLGLAAVAVAGLIRPAAAVVVAATAVAALAAPLTWSARTTDQPLLGINPLGNQEGRYAFAVLPPPLAQAFAAANAQQADPRLVEFLLRERAGERWIVATWTAMEAAPIELASGGAPVLALGGFQGTDPHPTPELLTAMVRAGELRFLIAPPPGASFADFVDGPSIRAIRWAEQACAPVVPAPTGEAPPGMPVPTLYDCRGAA